MYGLQALTSKLSWECFVFFCFYSEIKDLKVKKALLFGTMFRCLYSGLVFFGFFCIPVVLPSLPADRGSPP